MICRKYSMVLEKLTRHITMIAIFTAAACILIGLGTFLGSNSQASEDVNFKYYTSVEVKNGDTLWDIASTHITEEYGSLQEYVMEVKALNGLQNDSIRSGQSLVIPYYSQEMK